MACFLKACFSFIKPQIIFHGKNECFTKNTLLLFEGSRQICHTKYGDRCTIFRQTPAIYSSFPYVFLFGCSSLSSLLLGQRAASLVFGIQKATSQCRPASDDNLRTFFLSSNSGVYTHVPWAHIYIIYYSICIIYILYYTTSFASYTHFNSVRQSWKKRGKKAKDPFV